MENKTKSLGGIIYCRVSSQEQVQGTSLDGQKQACLEYATNKEMKVLRIFIEKGESATAANRTELIKALDFCKDNKGKVDAFIVWKIDRFARNTTDHYGLQAQLMKFGVSLHSVTEPMINDGGPVGKVLEAVLAGFAQFENDTRKARCEGGMQRKIEEGIWPWHPPIGYIHSKNHRTDRRKNVPDLVDTERFDLVQKGLKAYLRGEHSMISLTRTLNEWGLKTKTGKPMFKQLVDKMLRNKYYAGILVSPWTKEEHTGLHRPMITREEWVQIQLIKSGRSNNAIQPRLVMNPDFPLKGLVKCVCLDKYTASWQTGRGRKYPYYRCNNSDCELYNRNVSKDDLEDKFFEFLVKVTPSIKFLKVFRETTLRYWHTDKDLHSTRSKSYGQELNNLKTRLENLKEMREGGEIGRDEFMERKEKLENQITGLQISQNEAKTDELDLDVAISSVEYILTNIAKIWRDTKDIKQKQRLQRLVLPEGIAFSRNTLNFGTAVLSPVFSLNETFQTSPSDFVAGGGFEPPIFWL